MPDATTVLSKAVEVVLIVITGIHLWTMWATGHRVRIVGRHKGKRRIVNYTTRRHKKG